MAKGVYQHTSVSIAYIEERIQGEIASGIQKLMRGYSSQDIRALKAKGYLFIPACDQIRPDGHCAGHRKEEAPAPR